MDEKTVTKFVNLTIEIEETPQAVHYTVRGEIDENFRQKDVPRVGRAEIHLHLREVGNFNSCGIREWIHLINDLSRLGSLTFHECSVSAIDQINMVPSSLGGGTVRSFHAPYYCSCGREHTKLINVREHEDQLKQLRAPEFICECGQMLEFDALEESYFQFLIALPRAG